MPRTIRAATASVGREVGRDRCAAVASSASTRTAQSEPLGRFVASRGERQAARGRWSIERGAGLRSRRPPTAPRRARGRGCDRLPSSARTAVSTAGGVVRARGVEEREALARRRAAPAAPPVSTRSQPTASRSDEIEGGCRGHGVDDDHRGGARRLGAAPRAASATASCRRNGRSTTTGSRAEVGEQRLDDARPSTRRRPRHDDRGRPGVRGRPHLVGTTGRPPGTTTIAPAAIVGEARAQRQLRDRDAVDIGVGDDADHEAPPRTATAATASEDRRGRGIRETQRVPRVFEQLVVLHLDDRRRARRAARATRRRTRPRPPAGYAMTRPSAKRTRTVALPSCTKAGGKLTSIRSSSVVMSRRHSASAPPGSITVVRRTGIPDATKPTA